MLDSVSRGDVMVWLWYVCCVWLCAKSAFVCLWWAWDLHACLAQSVERKTLNLVVVGSSPTVGIAFSLAPRASCTPFLCWCCIFFVFVSAHLGCIS